MDGKQNATFVVVCSPWECAKSKPRFKADAADGDKEAELFGAPRPSPESRCRCGSGAPPSGETRGWPLCDGAPREHSQAAQATQLQAGVT